MLAAAHRRASAVRRFPPGCGRNHHPAHPPHQPKPRPPPSQPSLPAAEANDAPAPTVSRRASAVRRYPPGCGRRAAVPVPAPAPAPDAAGALLGDAKPRSCCNVGGGEGDAIGGGEEVSARESALDRGDSDSNNGGVNCGGGGHGVGGRGGAEEEEGGELPPLLPWAQRGRKSLRRRRLM